ncbi:hypothetical protein DSL72_004973 [Monilinia vaccinii-corymbosi]|uniref:Uncharacterized protein n=1 Tax=Monilinia vaccinii-corymbosi TaxID=61207 RepID=A0A8A3PEA4_9HELO|nr:hypothetical protein DSL72_004973 [Monilinia vaccinii-corymbosi]
MPPTNSLRSSAKSSLTKTTPNVAPPQEQSNMKINTPTEIRSGSGIRSTAVRRASRLFGKKKTGRPDDARSPITLTSQANRATFMIPPPLKKGPRPQSPIANHLGVEAEKPAHPDSEPKPLPLSWHRRYNEFRAAEMVAEEPAEKATEESSPSFVVGKESGVKQEASGACSSFVFEEGNDMEEDPEEDYLPLVAQNKGKGKDLGETPEENSEVSSTADLPAVATPKLRPELLRVSLLTKKDKGKGKAVGEGTEESTQPSGSDCISGSLPQISDDYNGSGEPAWASSSNDMSATVTQSSYTEIRSDEHPVISRSKAMKSWVPITTNPQANSLKRMPASHDMIDEGLHDRRRVVVGIPRPEALTLVFKTGKEDPKRPGVMQHLSTVTYQYEKTKVDWNSAVFVKGLNKWRNQILLRVLGSKSETRWKWTHGEMMALCDIVEAHLKSPKVNGLWMSIDWELVATVYNEQFEGVTQSAGELYARIKYKSVNGIESTSNPGKTMLASRNAPVRSSDTVRSQMLNFSDPRATNLVKIGKGQKQAAGLGSSSLGFCIGGESAWPANVPLKAIRFARGSRTPGPSLKRHRQNNEGSDEDDKQGRPPTKKSKLVASAGLRGSALSNGYDPNFNYADDSPPSGDVQGRQFLEDSPLRLARAHVRIMRAMAKAQHLLNPGGVPTNAAVDVVAVTSQ